MNKFKQKKRPLLIFWACLSLIQVIKIIYILNSPGISIEAIKLSILEFTLFVGYYVFSMKQHTIFDFLSLFTLFFFLYNHVYVILYFFVIKIEILTWLTETNIFDAFIISTLTFSVLCHVSIINSTNYINSTKFERLIVLDKRRIGNIRKFPLKNIFFLFLFAFFSILALQYSLKYFNLPEDIKTRRGATLKILWSGIGVYTKAIMIGVSIFYFVYFNNIFKTLNLKKKIYTILSYLPVGCFWVAHTMAGNRRELTATIIAFLIYWILIREVSLKRIFLIGGFLFTLMIYSSYSRGGAEQTIISAYTNSLGEFIAPYNTLVETVRTDEKKYYEYSLGLTYLYPIYAFVPRLIWPKKPLTLASQFSKDSKVGFGLGYSPMTESYRNWGNLSILMLPLTFLILNSICFKLNFKAPLFYIFILINVLNFNRSEFGTVLIEVGLMYIPFLLLYTASIKPSKKS